MEPFIEPTLDKTKRCLLPWNIVCSIKPILKNSDHYEMWNKNDKQKPKEMTGLNAKQLITVESGHLLNITLTKTGLDLIKHLSRLFDDLYKQRLVKSIEDNNPILSLLNATGQDLVINNLSGLEFAENSLWTLKKLKQNESVVFNALSERISSSYRLSMVEQQSNKNRQEFSLQIFNHNKLISINRTWQHIYNLEKSFHSSYPIQILSDTQIHHNQRRVILSSIIKIFNNAILPIIILDLDSITGKSYHRIEVNKEFYVPMDLLYKTSNSSIFIGVDEIDEAGDVSDFFVFDWITGKTQEQKLQLKNGQTIDLIIYKEVKQAYSENSDQLDRASYCIYIHSAIQLTNLLPVDIQCSINNLEKISLKPSQVRKITSGDKNAFLKFTIPSYNNTRWVSDPIDLRKRKKNDSNEQIITFRSDQQVLRMVLHLEMFQESYRLAIYVPFWITNHTDFQLDFRVENEPISIKNTDKTFLFCPEKYKIDAKGKGDIRLYTSTKDDKPTNWSEKFSVDVIKSTGMAGCEGSNHKTYMVCVDITTSSFGLTKIITFSPAMVIINQTSIPIEVVETIMGKRQNEWIPVERDGIIPFWPRNTKDSLMCVRYAHNHMRSKQFLMNKKHQTLLYMKDRERLVIFVEVIATDFDGVRIIFSNYKSGDAPLLLINYTVNQIISFVQKDETSVQYLVPEQFAYYTWRDPVKPRELIVACDGKPTNIELNPHRSTLDTNSKFNIVHYVVFIDGLQTILLFSDNQDIVETTLNIPLSTQSICRRLQISIPNFGLSIVNDIKREELLYISLNKSKLLWVQMKKSRIKPFPNDVHRGLENLYNENRQLLDAYPNDQNLRRIKYNLKDYREVTFQGDTAELIDLKGRPKLAKRQSLAGLWIEYTWSTTNAALYARINRLQIDNQLDSTNFPTMLYPVLPKTSNADIVEKPFIELSIYKSQTAQSDVMHIHYCKLLIQEFSFRIDQNFILAILSFIKEDKILMTSIINMDKDLEYIHKSLRNMIKKQIGTSSSETQMYFDHIHLSPLKIHISFSMYKSRANEDLFNEYPLVGFLLKAFNVGAVQDVILRLGYYERSFTRYTMTKLQNEILSHYQNQFLKQIHVLIFGLDVLGNPLGIIRGLAEGVESLFYEPYKGAIEGPIEFAEGLATGVLSFVGSTVGSAAGAVSRITGVIGTSLASLTFNDEYQASRIRDRERTNSAVTDIAMGGKNAVMGFVDGITGVVAEPVKGAAREGAAGFFKGVGRGIIGLVARPVGGIVDFASTSLNAVERTTTQEQIVHRIRYPRYVGRDGLVRPYISHEARGLYIFNRLEDGKYAKIESYVAHIGCTDDPPRWLMASGKRILFIVETLIGDYDIHWTIKYTELQQIPSILPDRQAIQFLLKTPPNASASQKNRLNGRLVDYRDIGDARYLVEKVTNVMHGMGF